MRKHRRLIGFIALLFCWASTWSFAASCSQSLICTCGPDISCSISTNTPGHTVNCWVQGNSIVCCVIDEYGNPVRDIHKTCQSCPGGGGGGGGPIEA